jgi:hypothetical protein
MKTFIDLLKESSLVQALITLVIVVTLCYMYVQSMNIPETLTSVMLLIVGYYFGTKQQQAVNKIQSARKDK